MQKSRILIIIVIFSFITLSCVQFNSISSISSSHYPFLSSNPKTSTYMLHAPIVINSDADWSTYATNGNGHLGNPWIIHDYLIDCNGTGVGISISNTDDFVIIENCFINNSQVAIYVVNASNVVYSNDIVNRSTSLGILMKACNNTMFNNMTIENGAGDQLAIDNCSNICVLGSDFVNASIGGGTSAWVTQMFGAGRSYNLTFDKCSFQSQVANTSDYLLDVTSTTGLVVNHCTFENGSSFYLDGSSYPNYNVMINDSIFRNFADYGIRVSSDFNVTIENSNLDASKYRTHNFAITLHQDVNITVQSCLLTGYYLTAIEGSANSHISYINNVIARSIYSQGPGGGNYNFASGFETGYTDYITIRGNWFYNCSPCIAVIDGTDPIVAVNYFNDHLNDLGGKSLYTGSSNYTWNGNFYRDYFAYYPHANLVNLSTNILNQAYDEHNIIDSIPRYYAPWFPRTDSITWAAYSSIDGLGIDMDWFKVLVNNFPVYNHVVSAQYVLYNIKIEDFANRTYYDQTFNVNVTKNVYIAIPITTLNIYNNGTVDAYFYFTRNNITTAFVISPGEVYQLRVIIGAFSYTVKYANGTVIKSRAGMLYSNINRNIAGPTGLTINFGFTKVTVPTTPQNPSQSSSFTWFDTLISITVFVIIAIVAIILYVIVYNRKDPSRVKESEHMRHRFKV